MFKMSKNVQNIVGNLLGVVALLGLTLMVFFLTNLVVSVLEGTSGCLL